MLRGSRTIGVILLSCLTVVPSAFAVTSSDLLIQGDLEDFNGTRFFQEDISENDGRFDFGPTSISRNYMHTIPDGLIEAFASSSSGPGLSSMRAQSWLRFATTPLSTDTFDYQVQATARGSDSLLIAAPANDPFAVAGFFTLSMSLSGNWLSDIGPVGVPDTNAGLVRDRWRVGVSRQDMPTSPAQTIGVNATSGSAGGDLTLNSFGNNSNANITGQALQDTGSVPLTAVVPFTFGQEFILNITLTAQVDGDLANPRGLDIFGEVDLGSTLTLNPIVEFFGDSDGDGQPDVGFGSLPITSVSGLDYTTIPEPGTALLTMAGLACLAARRRAPRGVAWR